MFMKWIGHVSSFKSPTSPNSSNPLLLSPNDIDGDEHYFGLENFGCTWCVSYPFLYINSVIQALYFCIPFRDSILKHADPTSLTPPSYSFPSHPESLANHHPTPISYHHNQTTNDSLLSHLKELFLSISLQKKRTGVIRPTLFVNKVKRDNVVFRSTQQQDAHEFLNYLLNALAETLQAGGLPADPPFRSSSWIHDLFEGELATETRCLTCESITQTRECFLDLSIDVEPNSSIASCLWSFSQAEVLCHCDKFFCDTCSGLQEAERSMKIKRLPPILALHLKRFKYMESLSKHVKLMHRVVFPTELRLFNQDSETNDCMYDLFAIVVHVGGTPNHGHYVALVRSVDHWVLFDDDSVDLVPEASIAKYFGDPELASSTLPAANASGYILFYQARGIT